MRDAWPEVKPTLDDKLKALTTVAKMSKAVEGWQDMTAGLNIRTAPRKDPEYFIGDKRLMTGQEWYDRFEKEISKSRDGEYYGIRQDILGAAKKAAGLAK